MSNTVVAYFKGRVGVCESLYQYDTGQVLVLDGLDLGEAFTAHFDVIGSEESILAIGQEDRVVIPDECLTVSGNVTVHIMSNTGENDNKVEYIVTFRVIGRARPGEQDMNEEQASVIEQAIAVIRTAVSKWRNMVASANTLPPGSEATATYADGELTLGIPRGSLINEVRTITLPPLSQATAEYEDEELTLGIPKGAGIESIHFDDENVLHVTLDNGQEALSSPVTEQHPVLCSEYSKTAVITSDEKTIALDMPGYIYSATDIIFVYINGLLAVPTDDYNVVTADDVASIVFTMIVPNNEDIYIRIIKSVRQDDITRIPEPGIDEATAAVTAED